MILIFLDICDKKVLLYSIDGVFFMESKFAQAIETMDSYPTYNYDKADLVQVLCVGGDEDPTKMKKVQLVLPNGEFLGFGRSRGRNRRGRITILYFRTYEPDELEDEPDCKRDA